MLSLHDAYRIALDVCDEVGIPYTKPKTIKANGRFVRKWGTCKKKVKNDTYHIEIAYHIEVASVLLDERNGNKPLVSTIIHELIHTVPGCWNHGSNFLGYASKVNQNTIYRVNIADTSEEKGIADDVAMERKEAARVKRMNHIQYKLRCVNCGREWIYRRRCDAVNHPDGCRCPYDKGKIILADN